MKDSNAQSYWQWCNEGDFTPASPALRWNGDIHALGLASALVAPPEGVAPATARAAADRTALAVDPYDTWARVSADGASIASGGVTPPAQPLFDSDPGEDIVEIAHTREGWLLIALRTGDQGRVIVRDLSDRFDDVSLSEADFAPDRIAVSDSGRIWLLDRGRKAARFLTGQPLSRRLEARHRDPGVFQGKPLDPDPLRLKAPEADLAGVAEEILDCAADADGRLILLIAASQRRAGLVVVDLTEVSPTILIEGLSSAFSLSLFGADKLAFLVPGAGFAVACRIPGPELPEVLTLLGDRLPLKGWTGGRFCKASDGAALYPITVEDPQALRPFRRLIALSKPEYARRGRAQARIVDGGQAKMTWHRLYAEARIPAGCGLVVYVAAGDELSELEALPLAAMHPHLFGAPAQKAAPDAPRAVWLDMNSELPFRASALGQTRKADRCGLFSVLVQTRPGDSPSRRISGRYLRVELAFTGSGLATPRLYALRMWGARNAYRDRYLPDFLTAESGPDAEGSDFLDRYLGLFESFFTPLEDQVKQSWRLTRPDAAPADALDYLGSWIGAELDSALSTNQKRRFLGEAIGLWRRRGTLVGVSKILDIVTDGGIRRGEVVVLEHFLMRRTFSTILGADLSDAENPLTPYSTSSGNSHLGKTFFLGAEDQRAFLALFRPQLLQDKLTSDEERAAAISQVENLFDQAAHRATVLVHDAMDDARIGLVVRAVEREAPAHVAVDVRRAPPSLVLGLSALVAVDSRIGPPPPRPDFVLGDARLSQAYLSDVPSLDERFEGGA